VRDRERVQRERGGGAHASCHAWVVCGRPATAASRPAAGSLVSPSSRPPSAQVVPRE
jgi:hypothetical protein